MGWRMVAWYTKCVLCKQEDLSTISRRHIKKKKVGATLKKKRCCGGVCVTPVLRSEAEDMQLLKTHQSV